MLVQFLLEYLYLLQEKTFQLLSHFLLKNAKNASYLMGGIVLSSHQVFLRYIEHLVGRYKEPGIPFNSHINSIEESLIMPILQMGKVSK